METQNMSDAMQRNMSELFLELAQEQAQIGFWQFNNEKKLFTISPQLGAILEITESEIALPHFVTFLEPEIQSRAFAALSSLVEQGTPFEWDFGLIGAKGRRRWVRVAGRCNTHPSGQMVYYGTVKDLTERKSKEQLLTQLVENLPLAFFAKDVHNDFRFCGWNKHAEEIFGLTSEQVIGKNDYDFFPKDQADFFRKKDLEAIQNGKILQISEEPATLPNGEVRWLRTSKVCLKDFAESQHLLIGLSENITELKSRTKELEDNRVKMIESARMSALGQMAAGISQEINNPLTIIYGKAAMLKKKLQLANAPVDQLEEIDKIEETADRIAKIIRGMKVFSQSEPGEAPVAASFTNLVQSAIEVCSPRFQQNGVELRVLVLHETIFDCHPGQVSQILLNLLNNAFDAAVVSAEKWVELRSQITEEGLEISITDSGAGIPREEREKIFEPFFSGKKGKGMGLGLSIAKLLAREHEGELFLDVKSPSTRFVLHLPIRRVYLKAAA